MTPSVRLAVRAHDAKPTMADLLRKRVERQARQPHDFGAVLDAMRFINTALIHDSSSGIEAFMDRLDAMAVIEAYVYERATSDEMHQRAAPVTPAPNYGP